MIDNIIGTDHLVFFLKCAYFKHDLLICGQPNVGGAGVQPIRRLASSHITKS